MCTLMHGNYHNKYPSLGICVRRQKNLNIAEYYVSLSSDSYVSNQNSSGFYLHRLPKKTFQLIMYLWFFK